MSADPSLDRTYQVEIERDALIALRMSAAINLVQVGLSLNAEIQRGASRRKLEALWGKMIAYRARYDAAQAAVGAIELHHIDSGHVFAIEEFATSFDSDRRDARRMKQDDSETPNALERALLEELRAIRDKVDPPAPKGDDVRKARKMVNTRDYSNK